MKKKTSTKSKPRAKSRRKVARRKNSIEQQYERNFTPLSLPFHGLYSDDNSLEQPSVLEDVLTTSAPYVEV